MPLPEKTVSDWLINHQNKLIVERYKDIPDGQPLVDFFAKFLYPSTADRRAYEERNGFIRRIVGFYRRGKLRKALGPAVIVYAPMIWLAERMKELPDYLQRTVDLYDMTTELDNRVVRSLCESIDSPTQLNENAYRHAMRKTSTFEERCRQVEEVINIGGYAVTLVERGGIVDIILTHVPHIPFFANNITVRGLNESLTMVQSGFRAFRSRKNHLQVFKDLCHQREMEYVTETFGCKNEKNRTSSHTKTTTGSKKTPVK